jgi:superfamily II DNA/RNA helicase
MISRDDILLEYLERLPYAPYPVQEQALYAWAECEHGVLLCAPTGMGKTLVAEGALYEALRTDQYAYYSTPLIALTDQKFLELQDTVERWGFDRQRVGLVTGHRTINPNAQIKVVVAEVLLNRLLHREAFDFGNVSTVVMDEFHSFNEPQRGMVWELSLSLLPKHIRVMLLSATIGAAEDFIVWMQRCLDRRVTLVQGNQRRVPLHFHWIGDELLPDHIEHMAQGSDTIRRTPALVFCFDREACWSTAETLKGKSAFADDKQRQALLDRLEAFDFSVGAGAKLRTLLARGIGVHHAGLLPRYRRVVETLFQEKLLPICVCTETLAAGLNLPARSVVLTTLVKGPRDHKKIIEASSAQQMFGRAGRPQFDSEGHVFALAHEDDVKIARWQEKLNSIPEDSKDPKLMAARKSLEKKKPTRRQGFVYWNDAQFAKLQAASPAKLMSKGRLSWRWLAHLLEVSPQVEPIRQVIQRRLMDGPTIQSELKRLTRMLVTLHELEIVVLDPPPPEMWRQAVKPSGASTTAGDALTDDDEEGESETATKEASTPNPTTPVTAQALSALIGMVNLGTSISSTPGPMALTASGKPLTHFAKTPTPEVVQPPAYEPITATPTPKLKQMTVFKAVHPLYGLFLMDYLGLADRHELVQILESLLEMPGSVARSVRVPWPDDLPPGALSLEVVDPAIINGRIATQEDLYPQQDQSHLPPELRKYPVPLAQKMRMLFESQVDHAGDLSVTPVWAAGPLVAMEGKFDQFIRTQDLIKQEGIIFKHMLRLILLCEEFAQLTPRGISTEAWQASLTGLTQILTNACRSVDPLCTDEMLEELSAGP